MEKDLPVIAMVSFASATETPNRKFASRPASKEGQVSQTCTTLTTGDSSAFRRDQASSSHPRATTSAFQGPVLRGEDSSSALPTSDPLRSENKSWQKEGREMQQARYSLRYVPNRSYVLQRSLSPTELPQCHDNVKDWPALGSNQSRTGGVEIRCNDTLVSDSRLRAKPRFRALYTRSSQSGHEDLRQDSVRGDNATRGIQGQLRDEARGEAKLIMLNRDFTVTSPVRENLLVTIALTSQRSARAEGEGEEELELAVTDPLKPVQILIGKFTAFSSFLRFELGRDALRVKFEQNAGGSSTISEVLTISL